MDDSSQDPVYSERQATTNDENQCTIQSNDSAVKNQAAGDVRFVSLETLSIEDVCLLLNHSHLSAITTVVRENQFSGNILATGVECVEDLKECGIKTIIAQSLFKHIIMWKEHGVPKLIFASKVAADTVPVDVESQMELCNWSPPSYGSDAEHMFSILPFSYGVESNDFSAYVQAGNRPADSGNGGFSCTVVAKRRPERTEVGVHERILRRQEKARLAREEKAMQIHNLTAALQALQVKRHYYSGTVSIGVYFDEDDIIRCLECSHIVNPEVGCKYNLDLLDQILTLPGVMSPCDKQKYQRLWDINNKFSAAMRLGKKRLQILQG